MGIDVRVDPSNVEQARAWDGDEGDHWTANAERFDASVAAYHGPLLDAAAIGAHDQVLDIGCGSGHTTRDAARAARTGGALGVDLSSRMIGLARRLAADAGVANARFEQADAQIHPFPAGSFDVALSRTGAMFFGEPAVAFGNISRALRPGGRLALLVWQSPADNEWIREFATALAAGRSLPAPPPDVPGPFSLADPDRVRTLLGVSGFASVELRALTAPMHFGRDVDDALRFVLGVTGWMLRGLDDRGRERALEALRTTIAAHRTPEGVRYASSAWLVTADRPA